MGRLQRYDFMYRLQDIRELRVKGLKKNEIARQLGMKWETVHEYCKLIDESAILEKKARNVDKITQEQVDFYRSVRKEAMEKADHAETDKLWQGHMRIAMEAMYNELEVYRHAGEFPTAKVAQVIGTQNNATMNKVITIDDFRKHAEELGELSVAVDSEPERQDTSEGTV